MNAEDLKAIRKLARRYPGAIIQRGDSDATLQAMTQAQALASDVPALLATVERLQRDAAKSAKDIVPLTGEHQISLDTSDPGKAADVAARAAILFARVSGYVAENQARMSQGHALAYLSDSFEAAIDDCFPEIDGEDKA